MAASGEAASSCTPPLLYLHEEGTEKLVVSVFIDRVSCLGRIVHDAKRLVIASDDPFVTPQPALNYFAKQLNGTATVGLHNA